MKPQVLISLHDITPFHLNRIKRAEALFARLGIAQVAYLLIPEYHGQHRSDADENFIAFCRQPHAFEVDWLLHGYYHLETPSTSPNPKYSIKDALLRRYMTAGEGEFLALNRDQVEKRIHEGQAVFQACLGYPAKGFIAPAWLHSPDLFAWLKQLGFAYTENHQAVHLLETNRVSISPVVTWATRTWLRRKGSLVVCPRLERLHRNAPLLRVALHPFDFDFPETVASIEAVLNRVLARREVVSWKSI
jgi:uncharacterized protein